MIWPSRRSAHQARAQAELQRSLGPTPAQAGVVHSNIILFSLKYGLAYTDVSDITMALVSITTYA